MDTENTAGQNAYDLYREAVKDFHNVKPVEDVVNHPNHYNQYNGFEVIDVCEQLRAPDGSGNYNRGNAFKYLARAGWKNEDKHIEDLEKAKFYIQREIERVSSDVWMKSDPIQEMVGPVKNYCPDCGIRLSPLADDTSVMVCINQHGSMQFRTGSSMGVWTPARETTFESMVLLCPTCGFKLKESRFEIGELYCEKHGRMTISREDGSISPEHDDSKCVVCASGNTHD